MAKSLERLKARALRRGGISIKKIAKLLGVSKSSASIWCDDIVLSELQIEKLRQDMIGGTYKGRMMGAAMNKQKKIDRVSFWEESAKFTLGRLDKRDLLMAGIGLYLGEGSKRGRFQFTNSSPDLIQAFIQWLDLFDIKPHQLTCRVFINEMHRERANLIKGRWVRITMVPGRNFQKPVFIKSKLKKVYDNHDTYLGVLAIQAYKSSELFYRVLGLMKVFLYTVKSK